MLKAVIEAMQRWITPGALTDPDVFLHAARVSVWGRWFIWLVGVFLLAYRPGFWYPEDIEYLSLPVLLGMLNGLVHLRLLTNRPVTWRWMLLLSATEIALITVGVGVGGGFRSFIFLAYYPSLAVFAVVFSSHGLSLAWTTAAAVTYAVVCLRVGSGLDLDAGNEKVLLARLAVMFTIVLGISLITRFERSRWQTSVTRERELRRERIELSQTIHDTTAQTAYMIGLGIHRARELAGNRTRTWWPPWMQRLRCQGRPCGRCGAPSTRATSWRAGNWDESCGRTVRHLRRLRASLSRCRSRETEPPLTTETRARLFSIAHNALTNAFLHARPGRVGVRLSFEADQIKLAVSDDGVGLPEGYDERGRGFNGMRSDAEHLGGVLIVESGDGVGGTTISCVVPYAEEQRGG